jgi:hypothetical protein
VKKDEAEFARKHEKILQLMDMEMEGVDDKADGLRGDAK